LAEVALHAAAPGKPAAGQPCNGCGVCCALITCPLGRVVFRRRRGPCPGLHWQADGRRYACGLVQRPGDHLAWLPASWRNAAGRLAARAIAAGSGCDCDAEVD